MILTIIAIFLLASIVLLFSLCRMARISADMEPHDAPRVVNEEAVAISMVINHRDKAA